MLTPQEIKTYIDNDSQSKRKKLARIGQRYYEGDHDIRQYQLVYFDAKGKLKQDRLRSNIKITHPFFTEHVDQQVQYMLSGKDGFIKSDLPELQEVLDEYFNENENFTAELYDIMTDCIVRGFGYAYAYKNEEGKISFQRADSLGVVEVKEKETDDKCQYVIYWYVDRISKDNKEIKRIEVWDSKQIAFYVQEGTGAIQPDKDRKRNPRPHAIYKEDGDESTYFEDFGFIPFFCLANNRKQKSGLFPIKDLIDDYDLMSCGLSNNIQDTNESLYVVKGFKGRDLDEIMTNIQTKKHIGVSENGDVDIKTIDVPYEARKIKLELDEKNIYRFGMGFNSVQLGDGNITNVVIKSRYGLLDMKSNKLEIRLKQFMRKLLQPVLDAVNKEQGTDYRQKDVYFHFEREIITNASDNAQIEYTDAQKRQVEINTILNLQTFIGDEKVLELVAEQLDIDPDELKAQAPKEEEILLPPTVAKTALAAAPTEEPIIGGGLIV